MLSATCLAIRSRAAVISNSALNVDAFRGAAGADSDADNMTAASELVKRRNLHDLNFMMRTILSGAGVDTLHASIDMFRYRQNATRRAAIPV
ncbi:hypothetical protein [Burkholderia sp. WSM2232]|uniref:hypothetical protein n=1 Tax=Burkholderia sp. WSM2232 TaxID=944436 RepID=UPI00047F2EC4|nr:hypothetical protein [Burkholderia sp. WSM2232]